MRILFYFGHPSQYLFLRNTMQILREQGNECVILIKSKDVLEELLIGNNETYHNILPEGRSPGRAGIISGLIKRDYRLFKFVRKNHFDLFVGTDPSLAHIGFLRRIAVITPIEDDISVISKLARITFPFTSQILCPNGCQTGRFEKKTVHYHGYMKLAYLHPKRFNKKATIFPQPYFIVRCSRLDAYHDAGISGFTGPLLISIVSRLKEYGTVYISSEGVLSELLKQNELKIEPSDMQDVLANATMLVSDSQSMTMEAAMLGIPSIRYSDFAGKISVLEELENNYKLTFGIPANMPDKLFDKINDLLTFPDLSEVFEKRRQKMLTDKIDVTAFIVWFIDNYPGSIRIIKENSAFQYKFK